MLSKKSQAAGVKRTPAFEAALGRQAEALLRAEREGVAAPRFLNADGRPSTPLRRALAAGDAELLAAASARAASPRSHRISSPRVLVRGGGGGVAPREGGAMRPASPRAVSPRLGPRPSKVVDFSASSKPLSPVAAAVPATRMRKKLPNFAVMGKTEPLEGIIRDKIVQRSQGGSHELRKAFTVFDTDGDGRLSLDEFKSFVQVHCNLKLSTRALHNFLSQFPDYNQHGHREISYLSFVDAIMLQDYPAHKSFTKNLAEVAADEQTDVERRKAAGAAAVVKVTVTNADDFEKMLHEKLTAKTSGGGGELARQFRLFDQDAKGYITGEEFRKATSRFGIVSSDAVFVEIMERYSSDGTDGKSPAGSINFYDFMHKLLPQDIDTGHTTEQFQDMFRSKMTQDFKRLGEAFRRLDSDHSGFLDINEMIAVCEEIKLSSDPEEIFRLAKFLDKDGDGQISYDEFAAMVSERDEEEDPAIALAEGAGLAASRIPGLPLPMVARALIDQHPGEELAIDDDAAISIYSLSTQDVSDDEEIEPDDEGGSTDPVYTFSHQSFKGTKAPDDSIFDAKAGLRDGEAVINGTVVYLPRLLEEKVKQCATSAGALRKQFKALDQNGDGHVTRKEFLTFLNHFALGLEIEAMGSLVRYFDVDGDGKIGFSEFAARIFGGPDNPTPRISHEPPTERVLVQPRTGLSQENTIDVLRRKLAEKAAGSTYKGPLSAANLRKTFRTLDKDNGGSLTYEQLHGVIQGLGISVSLDDFVSVAKQFDTNNDGRVDYKEFVAAVSRKDDGFTVQGRSFGDNFSISKPRAEGKRAIFQRPHVRAKDIGLVGVSGTSMMKVNDGGVSASQVRYRNTPRGFVKL